MKQINLFRNLLLVAFIGATGIAKAQIHPLSFGLGTVNTSTNWYANYVGLRFEVVSPASIVGDKVYKATNSGTGAVGDWGGAVTSPIVNTPIQMPPAGDSACTVGAYDNTIPVGSMTGKIGLVYRGTIDFGDKALDCQNAGAVACVIVNNVPGGPVGMSEAYLSGAATGSVTIPVFMISQADGNLMDSLYNLGIITHITITPWGQNLQNDLGFIPNGAAMWHNYAIPSNQLGASGNPTPYNMLDGAFIANYGTNTATGVKLKTNTYFTPTGGIATSQHTSEIDLATFTVADSIYAMFNGGAYALNASGTGRFDVAYSIESDSVDQYAADNSHTVSFYVTDSVYSKGTYDFVNNKPSASVFEGFNAGGEFLWGPMFYVANGGTAISGVQYTMAKDFTPGDPSFSADHNNILVFQWTDGVGGTADSLVQDGELQLVGTGSKSFGVNDTSEVPLYAPIYTDTNYANTGGQVVLQANSWYYVAIDVPSYPNTTSATGNQIFLGCDGVLNPYPRIFGIYNADSGASGNHLLDYSSINAPGTKDTLEMTPVQANPPVPGGMTGYVNSVDSFVFSGMSGLIPAVALIANNHPSAVKSVGKPLANVTLFPNPAKDVLNVSVAFDQVQKSVSYEIIDGLARFVSKETHSNVLNDTYGINTARLAPGNYYLIIDAGGKLMTRKFVVIK